MEEDAIIVLNLPDVKLGCHPIAWKDVPFTQVLDEVAATGYQGTEGSGPFRDDPAAYQRELASRHLQNATVYAGGPYYDPDQADGAVERALQQARFVKALGGNVLCVATGGSAERRNSPGFYPQGNRPDGLDDAGWRTLADSMNRLGEGCRELGITAAFHNHVGTYVETRDELDKLMSLVSADLLALAPDTGHLYYGGADPVSVYQDYAGRIRYMHFKDADAAAIDRARREKMNQGQCMAIGGFSELGRGAIDLEACLRALEPVHYAGWIMVEQDRSLIGPLQSAQISRAWLREHLGR
jgi:inosose dehydratase